MRLNRSMGAAAAAAVCIALSGATLRAPRATPGEQPAGATAVDTLRWLAGCWEGTLSSGTLYEEAWLPPRAGSLIGMSRATRDGRTTSWEFLRIVEEDGGLVYIAQPSGQALARFRATEVTATAATFENPEHDFPQRILYRHTPPDSLLARIEGTRDGQLRGLDFPLRRVACPG